MLIIEIKEIGEKNMVIHQKERMKIQLIMRQKKMKKKKKRKKKPK